MKLEQSSKFREVSHVIFDLDGTLLDTEKLYRQALFHVAKEYDKECNNEIVLKIAGTPQPITAKIAREEMELPIDNDTFLKLYNGFIHQRLGDCDLMAGAANIIKHFHKHKIPMAVATSSNEKAVQIKTRKHKDLFQLMDHFVCGDSDPEVTIGKPAPDIFLVCASRFRARPEPQDCLVFEDSLNGVKAGMSAGMQVIMVPEPHVPREYGQHATFRIDSLHHLQPENFGLPALNENILTKHFVCGDSDPEVTIGKPAPEPQDCLVFEDSLNGVKAGMSEDMQDIMVSELHVPHEYSQHATFRIDSLHHLQPEHFGLPALNETIVGVL